MIIDFMKILEQKMVESQKNISNRKLVRQIVKLFLWENVLQKNIKKEKREKKKVDADMAFLAEMSNRETGAEFFDK